MSRYIIKSNKGVTLLGGARVGASDLAQALALAPCLVAADGGADRALALGHMPEAVIGDFDSISPAARAAIASERLHPIAEQDSTDFGKCLRHVAAPFYLALGFSGGRLDHTLAALSELAARPHQTVVLIGSEDVAFRAPAELALDLAPGTRLSLYPMGRVRGRSTGLRWPIEGLALAPAGRIGTSNEATGPVQITASGPLLVLLPRRCLDVALAGLRLPPPVRGE